MTRVKAPKFLILGELSMEIRKVIKSTKVDYDKDYSCLDEDEDMMW